MPSHASTGYYAAGAGYDSSYNGASGRAVVEGGYGAQSGYRQTYGPELASPSTAMGYGGSDYHRGQAPTQSVSQGRETGRIIFFRHDKGYGFIRPLSGGPNVYFKADSGPDPGFAQDVQVSFQKMQTQDERGIRTWACGVQVLEPLPAQTVASTNGGDPESKAGGRSAWQAYGSGGHQTYSGAPAYGTPASNSTGPVPSHHAEQLGAYGAQYTGAYSADQSGAYVAVAQSGQPGYSQTQQQPGYSQTQQQSNANVGGYVWRSY